jgi:hypothetical protein
MVSYAIVKVPAPLLPQEYVNLGILVHDNDRVLVKFSSDPSLAALCAPVLARTRFDALQHIFDGSFQEEKFLTSRDSDGHIIELHRSDPDFLKLMAIHWQDSALRLEYMGTCKKSPAEKLLSSLYEDNIVKQDIRTLAGDKIEIKA